MPAPIEDLVAGGGEAGALIRDVDWARTPVGPVESWSPAMRAMVGLVMRNRFPLLLWWGPRFVQFYNDAYAPIPGHKHPRSMGQPAAECWPEIWDIIGPMIQAPFAGEPATWSDDLELLLARHGFLEETHFKVAYSPVPDDTVPGTRIGGVLATVAETTEQVYGERQLRTLREIGARAAEARTPAQACASAAAALRDNDRDVPFALLYLGGELVASSGFDGDPPPPSSRWPLAGDAVTVVDLSDDTLPSGHWVEPPRQAVVLPLRGYGVLVAGSSPHRALDVGYRTFFELAASQIAGAIQSAVALEEQRRRAEQLAELDRAKTLFFSNVSHEFRTPLTLMLGPIEEALGGALDGDALDGVHRNAFRLLKLVNTLLDFARIEAGRAQASYVATDLARLTRDLASVFRSTMERARLDYRVECTPLPEPIFVDRDMWEKIVLNLVSNAFKFTFDGEVEVALGWKHGAAELTVRDTGAGIATADQAHLFERFRRVEGLRARSYEGSGIGLALVKDLVALHGGSVAVASELGRGATFTVRIPAGTAHLPAGRVDAERAVESTTLGAAPFVVEATRWLPDDAAASATPREDAPHVLVADDNQDMRAHLRRLLEPRCRVTLVGDGEEAVAALRATRFDLVLTDVMMPRLDGFGLIRAIRSDPRLRRTPVVMLSARAGGEARVEGLEAGADAYVVKPFSARELTAQVHAQLELAKVRLAAEADHAKLELLLMTAPFAVVLHEGRDHRAILQNKVHRALIGGRDLVGHALLDAMPELRGSETLARLDRVFETGEPLVIAEGVQEMARPKSGEPRWFSLNYQPIRDARGEVTGVMSAAFEVTDSVRARHVLDDVNHAKDEFLAILGHELRNPLAPIQTALHLLELRSNGVGARERGVIARQVAHMTRLVDDLLDVARITRGKVELHRTRIEISEVIAKAIEVASPLYEQHHHRLVLEVPARGLVVEGDVERLTQAIANLLTNAAKYTPASGEIAVTARAEGGFVAVSVRDNGGGIPPEMLERIFEMFVQRWQSLERAHGGLGLGLTIVKNLVELHGGSVEARSDGPGCGSEFIVRLPWVAATSELTGDAPVAERAPTEGLRVLVVDDNADAASLLAELLRGLGFTTAVAFDGPSAVQLASEFEPQAVLLDIGLPVMDGYEVARRLRELPATRSAKLVAITGYGQESDRARSRGAGFDEHLVKPVGVESIVALLH